MPPFPVRVFLSVRAHLESVQGLVEIPIHETDKVRSCLLNVEKLVVHSERNVFEVRVKVSPLIQFFDTLCDQVFGKHLWSSLFLASVHLDADIFKTMTFHHTPDAVDAYLRIEQLDLKK